MERKITSRAIIGDFYLALEQANGAGWVDPVSMLFNSDQESEEYAWLGQAPAMREWIGGREAKGLRESGITIKNKKFESTLEIPVDWLRRDKTGQIQMRINEMAQRATAHWARLLSTLILNGASSVCYDGEYYFDTDHEEGESGQQSNSIGASASTATAPSAAEFETAVLKGVEKIIGQKDDQGEPMNEEASSFLVMVPVSMMASAAAALKNPVIVDSNGSRTNTVTNLGGFNFELAVNPRLSGWTDKFAMFRTDGSAAPLIRQEEEDLMISAVAEGSELEFNEDVHRYGVKALRNVGYGYWQHALLTTFS
jgi:phage major head subunit gpT-like protein